MPYDDCFELAALRHKMQSDGYHSLTSDEQRLYQKLKKKEDEVKRTGNAFVEERTGVTVYVAPTAGDVFRHLLGLKRKPKGDLCR